MKHLFSVAFLYVFVITHSSYAQHSAQDLKKTNKLSKLVVNDAIKGAVSLVQGLTKIANNVKRTKMPVYNPNHLDAKMKVWEPSTNYHYNMPNAYPDAINEPAMTKKGSHKEKN